MIFILTDHATTLDEYLAYRNVPRVSSNEPTQLNRRNASLFVAITWMGVSLVR